MAWLVLYEEVLLHDRTFTLPACNCTLTAIRLRLIAFDPSNPE